MKRQADTIAAAPQAAPHASGFVDTRTGRLHYLDYGTAEKPAMLCLHGGAAHGHWFDFIAGGFTSRYHVRALDQRGHGDSAWAVPPAYTYEDYAGDLAEAVEKLDLDDFALVGHSMGGMVSLLYAATHPGRVAQLVIVDTTMRMSEDRLAAMREVGKRPGRDYENLDEFVARFRLRPSGSVPVQRILQHVAKNSARRTDSGGWRHKFDRNVYAQRPELDGIPYWSNITMPALLVKGAKSARISPQVVSEIRARCPHVELAEIAQSDHHVTLDNPSGFVSAVQDFLSRHRKSAE
ncbi:MAG: alpha/beta fold hydrolase [Betaproteobacteria bacterium]